MQAARIKGGIGADQPYWDALERAEFRLCRCGGCGTWILPANYRCATCGSWDMAWEVVEPVGTIYTWSRVHYTPGEVRVRSGDLPYVAVLIEIPAAGNGRISGVLTGNEKGIAIGAPVRGVFLPPAPRSMGYATLGWEIDRGAAQ